MSKKNPWILPAVAGVLALTLAFAEEAQDVAMKQTIHHLEQELQLAKQDSEIHKTAFKIKSDLRTVTERLFKEEMFIDVDLLPVGAGVYKASVAVGTDLERDFYPELHDLVARAISMEQVDITILPK